MRLFIVRRLLQTLGMAFLLSVLFFLLERYQPSSLCYAQLGCTELMKLDEPITSQYVSYLANLFHGNFGFTTGGIPIRDLLSQRIPPTILLVGVSLTFQQVIALPLGMLAALRPYSRFDYGLTFLSYLFLSIPVVLLGNLIIVFFAFTLHWFPSRYNADPVLPFLGTGPWFGLLWQQPGYILGDTLRHLILPAFVLTAGGIAIDSRFMRGAMIQVLRQDYIRTARSKGVARRAIIFKHAFRNALLPIVTNLGLYVPALIGGVAVVEATFGYEGVGSLFYEAADFTTLQVLLLLSAIAVLLANLVADVGYALLDPRIRYETGAA